MGGRLMRWVIASVCVSMVTGVIELPLKPIGYESPDFYYLQAQTLGSFQQQIQALEAEAETYLQQGQPVLARQKYIQASNLVKTAAEEILATVIPDIHSEHPAEAYARQSFELAKKGQDNELMAANLNLLGEVQFLQGAIANARKNHQQAINLVKSSQSIGVLSSVTAPSVTIAYGKLNLGKIEQAVVNNSQARSLYDEALATFQSLNHVEGQILTLQNIADLARQQRNPSESLRHYRQALQLARQTSNQRAIANTLFAMGELQNRQRQYPLAKKAYAEALDVNQTGNDLRQRGKLLNRLGSLELRANQDQEAMELYNQALRFAQQIGDLAEQGSILRNISILHQLKGNYQDTFNFLQQASLVYHQMGLRGLEAEVLAEMGATQNVLGNKELAILFYKQAIKVFEERRAEVSAILGSSTFRNSRQFAAVYRRLSELLLSGDRPAEAQQAVDLLKVQEPDEYLGNVTANEETVQAVDTLPAEQEVLSAYDPLTEKAIALGRELLTLLRTPRVELTEAQQQRISEITTLQQDLTRQFSEFSRSPDVKAALKNVSDTAREQNLSLNTLRRIADNLQQLEERSIILYPLVLEDRLELIVASPFAPPIRRTVNVSREELNETIAAMRQAITTVRPNMRANTEPSKKLYNWLIAPIEGDIQATGATTIIYAPDDQLRYVPLAALHDGDRWLIERFRVNYMTAANLDDFTSQPSTELDILAGAFTEGEFDVNAGTRSFSFEGLPFAGTEINNIATTVPSTATLFDKSFTKAKTLPEMNRHNIVHFATHAAFVPGDPDHSFILYGDGDHITLWEVKDSWFLTNVDLIVLSACQTAVGGEMGNGEEILGFGYLMQNAGAKAAMASLWSVSDGGTQVLMNDFYDQLPGGQVSKAEALRQAQIGMIKGKLSADGQSLSHPYYWAPFILIGNGL